MPIFGSFPPLFVLSLPLCHVFHWGLSASTPSIFRVFWGRIWGLWGLLGSRLVPALKAPYFGVKNPLFWVPEHQHVCGRRLHLPTHQRTSTSTPLTFRVFWGSFGVLLGFFWGQTGRIWGRSSSLTPLGPHFWGKNAHFWFISPPFRPFSSIVSRLPLGPLRFNLIDF